jgi:hypothetical protein
VIVRLLLAAALCLASWPALADVKGFVRQCKPAVGQQHYFAGVKLARPIGRFLQRMGLGRWVHERQLVQITNSTLRRFTDETSRGYLEVVVPAKKGHVFFRHGADVYDFYQGGFRCGPVRPIGSERYGMLVRLTPEQEGRLQGYLDRLKRTGGKELGTYDFTGEKGFHCVSWLMRQPLDGKGRDLLQLLGARPGRGMGMPSFSRFLLRRAEPLEAVAIYNRDVRSPTQLSRMRLQLMSSREIVKAHREQRGRSTRDQ